MKILVTGGAGFIGSHVVDAYLDEGHDVVVVDTLSSGTKEHLNPQAQLYEVNICSEDLKEVFSEEKPEVVVHLAAQISVTESLRDPTLTNKVNVGGTRNILECSVKNNVKKFIFSSSCAVYDDTQIPSSEETECNPPSAYGESKREGEVLVRDYAQKSGMEFTILRYANVYGPRQRFDGEGGVVAIFCHKLKHHEQPIIYGDGMQTRDFVFVKDIAHANVLALTKGGGSTLNVGSGKETSIVHLFEVLKEISTFDGSALFEAAKEGEARRSCLTTSNLELAFNWKPDTDLKEGLAVTFDAMK